MRRPTNFTFLLALYNGSAQVVDKSINGVQIGFLAIRKHNKSKMTARWALKTKIGYEALLNPNNKNNW